MFVFLEDCDACETREERVFTDNWTGKSLCSSCLYEVIGEVTNSPGSEGDNLMNLLIEKELLEDDKESLEYHGWI